MHYSNLFETKRIINNITWNMPNTPRIGYKKFNKLLKPKLQQKVEIAHIIKEYIKYCFLFLEILFKKLNPAEPAVV